MRTFSYWSGWLLACLTGGWIGSVIVVIAKGVEAKGYLIVALILFALWIIRYWCEIIFDG